jgi:BMFP domain-containing protein YqiC
MLLRARLRHDEWDQRVVTLEAATAAPRSSREKLLANPI